MYERRSFISGSSPSSGLKDDARSKSRSHFLQRYTVLDTIGAGSFGEVLRVKRNSDEKELVCKVLWYGKMKERERSLIVSEVNILRELRHPNIVRYYDRVVDKEEAKLYIVMELCEGGDLGKLIKRHRRSKTYVSEDFVWHALSQLLQAFSACHSHVCKDGKLRPILHRDIKPCNIFLDSNGNIKVGDFGLAKELKTTNSFATTNVGTPYYMSPELISEKKYNEKSDVWALGCLVYELAALRPPFEALNALSLSRKICSGRFQPLPKHYSKSIRKLIARMLSLNPSNRPSVSELKKYSELARIYGEDSPRKSSILSPRSGTEASCGSLPGSVEKASNENSVKTLENYIEAKLAEISRREEELYERSRKLKIREQDLCFREKLLICHERTIDAKLKMHNSIRESKHSFASVSTSMSTEVDSSPGYRSPRRDAKSRQESVSMRTPPNDFSDVYDNNSTSLEKVKMIEQGARQQERVNQISPLLKKRYSGRLDILNHEYDLKKGTARQKSKTSSSNTNGFSRGEIRPRVLLP